MRTVLNEPIASILMQSMRSMGYTFEAAIADIIDNSISANARNISIEFPIDDSDLFVYIMDDGFGMSYDELYDAMKYGSNLKSDGRSDDDLGRFGLGLKSASLSQCKKLTVVSKKNGQLSGFIWDIDHIIESNKWEMIEVEFYPGVKLHGLENLNDKESGTIVLWEKFDVIEQSSSSAYSVLMDYRDSLIEYIALIFHRFISEGLVFKVNNYIVEGLDPFLEEHKKTNVQRVINIPIKDSNGIDRIVKATPYVLPYQRDMKKSDLEKVGGIENYKDKQGFYLYRNKRLIIWGTWFGYRKHELTKNARIKIDIPNTLDDLWSIDIKKQSASIPTKIKRQLTNSILDTMGKAKRVHEFRGRVQNQDEDIDFVWNRLVEREKSVRYEINFESKIFECLKNKVDDAIWREVASILKIIQSTLPIQQLYLDKANDKNFEENAEELNEDLITLGVAIANTANNLSKEQKLELLQNIEVFRGKEQLMKLIGEKI